MKINRNSEEWICKTCPKDKQFCRNQDNQSFKKLRSKKIRTTDYNWTQDKIVNLANKKTNNLQKRFPLAISMTYKILRINMKDKVRVQASLNFH